MVGPSLLPRFFVLLIQVDEDNSMRPRRLGQDLMSANDCAREYLSIEQ